MRLQEAQQGILGKDAQVAHAVRRARARPWPVEIADAFDVFHASPQLLLIHDGECEVEWEQNEIHLNAIRTEIASL